MGMYTELVLKFEISKESPIEVLNVINHKMIHKAQQHYLRLFCTMSDADAFGFAMDYLREVYLNEKSTKRL